MAGPYPSVKSCKLLTLIAKISSQKYLLRVQPEAVDDAKYASLELQARSFTGKEGLSCTHSYVL